MFNKAKSHGFTLAEVLITLGIIGVVAALTLPNLIANYQKMVWATQLKKTVSTLEQGFQKLLADEGVDRLMDLPSDLLDFGCCEGDDGSRNDCKELFNQLNKYFSWSYENFDTEDKDAVINLNDGSQIYYFHIHSDGDELSVEACSKAKSLGGNMCAEFINELYIDVNGYKKPNEMGKDRFTFVMSGEGKIYPLYGKDEALYNEQEPLETNNDYWKNEPDLDNWGLTARVVEKWMEDRLLNLFVLK